MRKFLLPAPVTSAGIAGVTVQDETVDVGTPAGVTILNFTGAGVTASGAGATVDVTIPGGGGGGFNDVRTATWIAPVGGAIVAANTNAVYVRMPQSGTIVSVAIGTIGGTGSCVVDVRKDTYANFPPTGADTICGGNKPTISSAIKMLDTTLTSWTTSVTAGDWISFVLDSSSVFTAIFVSLEISP